MNASPNNVGARWGGPTAEELPSGPTPAAPKVVAASHPDALPSGHAQGEGSNALQALLAFACLQEQAAKRRALERSASPSASPDPLASADAEFALDEVLQLVAARAISITGADGVAIALAEETAIVCRASSGRIAPDPGVKLDPNSGFSGACLRSGHTIRCDDSDADSRVNAQACRALGARSMIAVPLSTKKRIVGLLEAFSTDTFGFNDRDVRSLNLLGELILAAIRPEEEDRLAELAGSIVVPPSEHPAIESDTQQENVLDVIATIPHIPARVITDEKFAPFPLEPAAAPTAAEVRSVVPIAVLPDPEQSPIVDVPPLASYLEKKERRSLTGILLTAALLLIVIGIGGAVVWKEKYGAQAISDTAPAASVKNTDFSASPVSEPAPAPPEAKSGATPEVTGIRHWSANDSSTVVVDLQDQVQYEAHSLDNPARIYFDLRDTKLASGVSQNIDVNDTFVKRVRVAQPTAGVTRVVLETKNDAGFSVSLESNPYRLTIELHKPVAGTGMIASPANLSKPSPVVNVAPKKKPNDTKGGTPSLNPTSFQIVLDAGHGGWDLGTVGKKGLLEKDLVLDIVQRLGKLIDTKLGVQVLYTRQDDSYLPLEKRAEIANLAKADLFLSVHANYSDLATARGVETYYTTTYSSVRARTDDDSASLKDVNWTGVDIREKVTGSHRLASDVQQSLYGGLAARNPEIRNRGVKEAQYVVLTGTQMPAVLAEVSFVSSPSDEDRLQSSEYRQQIAEALYKGVARYHQEITHTKLASAQKSPHP